MKSINTILLAGAIILISFSLYFWLSRDQIDHAAFYFALAAVSQSSYLMATKAGKTANKYILI